MWCYRDVIVAGTVSAWDRGDDEDVFYETHTSAHSSPDRWDGRFTRLVYVPMKSYLVMLRFQNHVNFPFRIFSFLNFVISGETRNWFFFSYFRSALSVQVRWISKLIIRPITWFTMSLWLPQHYHNISEAYGHFRFTTSFVITTNQAIYLYQETRSSSEKTR